MEISDIENLNKIITDFLILRMRLKNAYIYLKEVDNSRYSLTKKNDSNTSTKSLSRNDSIISYLNTTKSALYFEGNNETKVSLLKHSSLHAKSLEYLRNRDLRIAIPCINSEGLVAVIILGEKKSGQNYDQADMNALERLAHDAAIALENARLYDDLKKSFSELKATKDQLVQSEKLAAVGQLAAGVAHEVNNPLAVIRGQAAIKLKEYKNVPEPLIRFMEEVISQTDRAVMITKKLLRFAKPRRGEIEAFDLSRLLDESVDLVCKELSDSRVQIRRNYPPAGSVKITAHSQQIQEVFINLIQNSFQAMPEGGNLDLDIHQNNGVVQISFSDTGKGISPEESSKVFDPFYTTRKDGTGLGLFVSYKIIKAHGGDLQVSNHIGQGTTFTMTLPSSTSK
jgi:signal transduction histidine kinase